MRRIISLIIVSIFLVVATACGSVDQSGNTNTDRIESDDDNAGKTSGKSTEAYLGIKGSNVVECRGVEELNDARSKGWDQIDEEFAISKDYDTSFGHDPHEAYESMAMRGLEKVFLYSHEYSSDFDVDYIDMYASHEEDNFSVTYRHYPSGNEGVVEYDISGFNDTYWEMNYLEKLGGLGYAIAYECWNRGDIESVDALANTLREKKESYIYI